MDFFKIFLSLLAFFFFTACSKKVDVSSFSKVQVPLKELQNVNITIEGSHYFQENIEALFPAQFQGYTILEHDQKSPWILHIIEQPVTNSKRFYDSQEEKTIQYVSYVYDKTQNKTVPIVKERDIIYFQRCMVTDFTLSASITTRYKRENVSATIEDKNCIKRRWNIFNENEFYNPEKSNFYPQLVEKLTLNIKNYLVPYSTNYTIALEEEVDVELLDKEEESYENILEMLDDGIYSNQMLQSLEKLQNKYPTSYAILYNLGVLYEYLSQDEKALFSYQEALKIKMTKEVLHRIATVQNNIENKSKLKLY